MNNAPDFVLIDEIGRIVDELDDEIGEGGWLGIDLLNALLVMPKHIRAALAKRLLEDA
jgi:hypothetical protein